VKRGEIYLADVSPRSGAEQRGHRPVIVVSHDAFHRSPTWRSVIVVPVSTSALQAERGPTVVRLPKGSGGLQRESVALGHQITTLDRGKLFRPLGALSDRLMAQVGVALKNALSLD
jgi:mRNA interferase MazF